MAVRPALVPALTSPPRWNDRPTDRAPAFTNGKLLLGLTLTKCVKEIVRRMNPGSRVVFTRQVGHAAGPSRGVKAGSALSVGFYFI